MKKLILLTLILFVSITVYSQTKQQDVVKAVGNVMVENLKGAYIILNPYLDSESGLYLMVIYVGEDKFEEVSSCFKTNLLDEFSDFLVLQQWTKNHNNDSFSLDFNLTGDHYSTSRYSISYKADFIIITLQNITKEEK